MLPTDPLTIRSNGLFGVTAGVSTSKSFDDLMGLSISYSLNLGKDFHRRDFGGPNVGPISTSLLDTGTSMVEPNLSGADTWVNFTDDTGIMPAAKFAMSNGLSASMSPLDWLSLSASFTMSHSVRPEPHGLELEEMGLLMDTSEVIGATQTTTSFSYSLVASISIPQIPYLGVSTGLGWYHGAFDMAGQYRLPFHPHDTSIFLNLSVNAGKLADELF